MYIFNNKRQQISLKFNKIHFSEPNQKLELFVLAKWTIKLESFLIIDGILLRSIEFGI